MTNTHKRTDHVQRECGHVTRNELKELLFSSDWYADVEVNAAEWEGQDGYNQSHQRRHQNGDYCS